MGPETHLMKLLFQLPTVPVALKKGNAFAASLLDHRNGTRFNMGALNFPSGFFTRFVRSQLFTKIPYPTHSFAGQTILITGANVGLGLEAARHFVRLGAARVILGCRSISKGEAAVTDIENSTQCKGVVEVWEVDLSSYKSVKAFCEQATKLDRLDVVVENAGIAIPVFEEVEGMESTITVNVISTFLMALLLVPVLRASGMKHKTTPNLVIVSSDAHEQASFKEQSSPEIFKTLATPSTALQPDRYNVSKLLEILVIRSLGPDLSASSKPKIILNTPHPGFCHSDLMRHAVFPLNALSPIAKLIIGRSTEEGSRTLVASACAGEDTHGCYMVDCEVQEPSAWVRSGKGVETQGRVYKELLEILEGIEPGVTGNI
ncbi:putative retinol dehydrogenase protein [Venustampulla echinocandica]|uniref:Putative retinol dehydrogenase protein n=1 Tax=Venustampulla echinocandica TaxID=2656787 RepID=A0A370TLP7_9HELO|nr:putative retinol dehydrogenase protein [Venustampulla echinocandica]RDL36445.1 putative retinol dehydrogenase protein [Venustampulla echinocandica]